MYPFSAIIDSGFVTTVLALLILVATRFSHDRIPPSSDLADLCLWLDRSQVTDAASRVAEAIVGADGAARSSCAMEFTLEARSVLWASELSRSSLEPAQAHDTDSRYAVGMTLRAIAIRAAPVAADQMFILEAALERLKSRFPDASLTRMMDAAEFRFAAADDVVALSAVWSVICTVQWSFLIEPVDPTLMALVLTRDQLSTRGTGGVRDLL